MAKTTTPSVEYFLHQLKHPMKEEILSLRKIILNTDKKLTEHIKWNAPSYCYNGDDRITLNLSGKGMIRLVFHCGAKVKDNKAKTRLFEDTTGLLDWAANDRAIAKFTDEKDILSKKQSLQSVIKNWIKYSK